MTADEAAPQPAELPEPNVVQHDHPDVMGGWLRPSTFGAMDGLVSNFALIAGMVGGTSGASTTPVVLAGLAGLAAGAFSMAAGEYTSVASQAEHALREIEVERQELIDNPQAERDELVQMFVDQGIDRELAEKVATHVHSDIDLALDVHTRMELALDSDRLPSPMLAAVSSFLSFAVGAMIPVLPYLLGADVIWPALVLSMVGLFAAGAIVSTVTSRSWWYGGVRQMVLGGAAAALTYLIGDLVGTSLG